MPACIIPTCSLEAIKQGIDPFGLQVFVLLQPPFFDPPDLREYMLKQLDFILLAHDTFSDVHGENGLCAVF